jgi:hypothetical protein
VGRCRSVGVQARIGALSRGALADDEHARRFRLPLIRLPSREQDWPS